MRESSGGSSSSSGQPTTVDDPSAFTVSYRNKVRLPWEGSALTADRFAAQIASSDPVGGVRCGAETSPAYRDVTEFLGGIAWTHPMAILKDASLPPLYAGPQDFSMRNAGIRSRTASTSRASTLPPRAASSRSARSR